jgi:hypothetical protein
MQQIDYGLGVLRTDVLANWPQKKQFETSLKNIRPNNTNPSLMPKVGISDYEAFAMLEVECGKVNDQR